MASLFLKTKNTTKSLLEIPFKTEDEFEKIVFSTPELLEDIFLLKRQVRGGSKPGIPDILGVDRDGKVCIIELKNVLTDASVIPQVLEYAIWAETNPDSIKSLWLENTNKPDQIEVDWDSVEVRIIVIAPSIASTTLQFVERINYSVDLLEIKRWQQGLNEIIMVNKLEQDQRKTRVKSARGMAVYDIDFYKSERNKESVNEFLRYVKEVETVIKKRGWNLETKYNRSYCGFKAGFFNAFSISWMGSKTIAFSFRLSVKEIKTFKLKPTKYDEDTQMAYFYIEPAVTKTSMFGPIFEHCYKRLGG